MFELGSFCTAGIILLIFFIIFIILIGIRIINPRQKGLIERLGKFRKVADQGFHLIIPIVDRMYKVNLTEQMMDVRPQEVITKDNPICRINETNM